MIKVSVMGGSGYVGGELLRILVSHPSCEVQTVTSQRYAGEPVYRIHPNLRGLTALRFQKHDVISAGDSDVVFTALPHGKSMSVVPVLLERGMKVLDMTADFRLKDTNVYNEYYSREHTHPELLEKSVYGLPELHRREIKNSQLVAVPGCMATASILGLVPLIQNGLVDTSKIVVDAAIGSSGAGVTPTIATHHSERTDGVRPYKVTGHRHIAEVEQELSQLRGDAVRITLTPHAVNMVRGILATIHAFTRASLDEKEIWKAFRACYAQEPFIRMVSDQKGLYGLPNPKVTVGTNFCDIGFSVDPHVQGVIVFSAIDNLTKGAAGQGVQCFNIMQGLEEKTGLDRLGLHP